MFSAFSVKKRRFIMGLFGEVKCGRCDRRYSAIRRRCPYCGARRRTGKSDRGSGRGQMIAGLVILAIIIIAVVVLIVMSLRSKGPAPSPSPSLPSSTGPVTVTSTPKPTTSPRPTQSPTPTPTMTPRVTSVTLNREDFTLFYIGEQWTMTATVVPANTGLKVKWTSLDPKVATIDENGVVTAVGPGTTTVVAEVGGVRAECIVRVTAAAVTPDPQGNIPRLSHTDVTLDAGTNESFRLTVEGTAETPVYYSEDYNIASVAPNGVVTAVSEGVVSIYVTVGDTVLECIVRVIRR